MVGWHYRLNGHKFEQTPGDSEGQGSMAYCSMGRKESDMTDRLNNNRLQSIFILLYCCEIGRGPYNYSYLAGEEIEVQRGWFAKCFLVI